MTQSNGHNAEAIAIDDIKAMASKIPESLSVIERVPDDGGARFDQKTHDLMLASVDRITTQWIDELVALRDNTKIIEQMVIEHAAKVKNELTKLHLLGAQAMLEAQRGHDVLQKLHGELDAMMAERN